MSRLLLLLAFVLLCNTLRADAQVYFEPATTEFTYTGCSLDTTLVTSLINTADTAVIAPFVLGPGLSVVEAPEGWGQGAQDTINANDTVRLVLYMSGVKKTSPVRSSVEFQSEQPAKFSASANWNYTELTFTRAGRSFEKMQLSETRHDTIVISNPSLEFRQLRFRKIIYTGPWQLSGATDGDVLAPGTQTNLIVSYTATELPEPGMEAELSLQIRDTCVGFDFYFNATLSSMTVAVNPLGSLSITQNNRMLRIPGYPADANISLSDVAGRTYHSAEAAAGEHQIDLTSVPSGPYFVRVSIGATTQTWKIVIQ